MNEHSIGVFLADDHAMVREGLAALLGREDGLHVVGQCGDGLEVTRLVGQTGPDVVVLDIMMPGLNGLEICRVLKRKNKNLPVLILTMYDDEQFISRALEYGATGFLAKETASVKLGDAIRTVARGGIYLDPNIQENVLERIKHSVNGSYDRLTTRERQVLQGIAEGKTNRQTAEDLDLAVKTVDSHRHNLMQKLNIHDQTGLVKYALRMGLVSLD